MLLLLEFYLPSYATTNVVTSEPSAFVNAYVSYLKLSDIAPEVCKSISELEPSAFKNGICAALVFQLLLYQ